jgi:hypothetical protein
MSMLMMAMVGRSMSGDDSHARKRRGEGKEMIRALTNCSKTSI